MGAVILFRFRSLRRAGRFVFGRWLALFRRLRLFGLWLGILAGLNVISMRRAGRHRETFNFVSFHGQRLIKVFPRLLAIGDVGEDALAGIIGDLGHPHVEIATGAAEVLPQGRGVLLQLTAEFSDKIIVTDGESGIVRIECLAIQRRDVKFLLQNPKVSGLCFTRREAGRRRRLRRPERGQAKNEDRSTQTLKQDTPFIL